MSQQREKWRELQTPDPGGEVFSESSQYEEKARKRGLMQFITGLKTAVPAEYIEKGTGYRIILLYNCRLRKYSELHFMREIMLNEISGTKFCSIAGNSILAVTRDKDEEMLITELDNAKADILKRHTYNFGIIYSRAMRIEDTRTAYERMMEKSEYIFYFEPNCILHEDRLIIQNKEVVFDYRGIVEALKHGDAVNTVALLESFFDRIKNDRPKPVDVKAACYQLYACIIRCCPNNLLQGNLSAISQFSKFSTLEEIEEFIMAGAMEIVSENDLNNAKSYSTLIKDTVKIINDNIGNEKLSLRWLAGTILFTNVDYLGKLFKKETGKNFSHYVMEKRMELAKALIIEKDRVYEVAEKVGYGTNSQYFSHVFKKYTGISPLEYKERVREGRSETAG